MNSSMISHTRVTPGRSRVTVRQLPRNPPCAIAVTTPFSSQPLPEVITMLTFMFIALWLITVAVTFTRESVSVPPKAGRLLGRWSPEAGMRWGGEKSYYQRHK